MIRQATQNLQPVVQVNLPSIYNMKRTVQRARYANNFPPLPATLEDLDIPDFLARLSENYGNELFLKFDSGRDAGNNRLNHFSLSAFASLKRNNVFLGSSCSQLTKTWIFWSGPTSSIVMARSRRQIYSHKYILSMENLRAQLFHWFLRYSQERID